MILTPSTCTYITEPTIYRHTSYDNIMVIEYDLINDVVNILNDIKNNFLTDIIDNITSQMLTLEVGQKYKVTIYAIDVIDNFIDTSSIEYSIIKSIRDNLNICNNTRIDCLNKLRDKLLGIQCFDSTFMFKTIFERITDLINYMIGFKCNNFTPDILQQIYNRYIKQAFDDK